MDSGTRLEEKMSGRRYGTRKLLAGSKIFSAGYALYEQGQYYAYLLSNKLHIVLFYF
jgi:hypothetical protein